VSERKLLFSLGAKDFEVQTFCTGGNGGQHRNAKQNGVRIIHPASGARGEHRDGRDQGKNREQAFSKLVASEKFKRWHKAEAMRLMGLLAKVDEAVDEQMKQVRVDVKDANGRWVPSE
jgi:protein subunit release factor A